jgi:putative MATE family efflux protein
MLSRGAGRVHDELTTAPIPRLVLHMAVPASVGYFFQTMFNVVDTAFAGMVPGMSTRALAALAASFPVFFLVIALGGGLSTGATALLATALGQGDRATARRLALQGLGLGLAASLALSLLGPLMAPFLFRALGAEGPYLDACLAYMNPILRSAPLFIIPFMENAALVARGDTRSFRNILIVGSVLNVGLDPWFIFGGLGLPPLGLPGIAWATVLTQALGCLYLGRRLLGSGLVDAPAAREFLPCLRTWGQIAHQGLPAAVNMLTVGLGIFVITRYFSLFGPEATAAYGIATRIEQIALMPTIGLGAAVLTLTAQNRGAGKPGRVRETLRCALRCGAAVTLPAGLGVFLLAGPLMRLFTSDPAVVDVGAGYLRIAAFVLFAYVLLYQCVSAMQGLQRPLFAVWLGLARQVVLPVLLFEFFTRVLGLGLSAIWWGIAGIVWAAALFAASWVRRAMDRMLGPA